MKYRILIVLFLFCGCTSDHYVPVDGSGGSQEHLQEDLKYCRDTSIHAALKSRNNGAAMIGGVVGGAAGGIIFGAAFGSGSAESSHADINKGIENCMVQKGYEGTSEHYN